MRPNKIFVTFLVLLTYLKIFFATDYGDIYITTLLGDASYLNPVLASDSASGSINGLVYNGLVKYNKDLNLVGDLATRWEIKNGGKEIIFYLRKDVYWHDGKPFTAEDVKFTYEKLVEPNIKTPYSSDFMLIQRCEILDKYTIKFVYRTPFVPALESWSIGIIPKHIFDTKQDFHKNIANRAPVGTGPYKFVKWVTDEKIELVANENYFEGKPYISRCVFKIIPDQSVQFLELLNQSIDSMNLTPDQAISKNKKFVNYNFFEYPSFSYTYLGFNLQNPLFKDVKVRRAIAHAINKTEIIKGVLLDKGKVATGPFVPQSWAYNDEVVDYEYNPELAKKMLSACGWQDLDQDGILEKKVSIGQKEKVLKFSFTLITNQGNKSRQLAAEIIQQQLKKVGIKVDIQTIEWSVFINNYINTRNFEAVILGWNISVDPDQYLIWHSGQTKPGQYNFVSYSNKEVDKLLDQGRQEFDFKKRKEIYKKVHKLIHQDVPYIFLYYPNSLPVVHKRFKNVELTKAGIGWNFIRWYVPQNQQKYFFSQN
jgi:peptide/nickel transport system substrate-binding protein